MEVAQVARTCARALRLNEDLTEAIALSHDVGHGPFGHAGEAALDDAMKPSRRLRAQRERPARRGPARAPLRGLSRVEPLVRGARVVRAPQPARQGEARLRAAAPAARGPAGRRLRQPHVHRPRSGRRDHVGLHDAGGDARGRSLGRDVGARDLGEREAASRPPVVHRGQARPRRLRHRSPHRVGEPHRGGEGRLAGARCRRTRIS